MPSPFETLDITEAKKLLKPYAPPAEADAARRFVDGDHWQAGTGWMGPRPAANQPGYAETMAEIARAFVTKNAVGEAVNRHRAGVVGKPPAWRLTVARALVANEETTSAEQALIAEAEAALTSWWDTQGVAEALQAAVTALLCAGRVSLRLFVPPGLLDEAGRLPPGDLPAQLARVAVEVVAETGAAAVVRDADTRAQAGLLLSVEGSEERLELSFVGDDGATVLRIVGATSQEVTLPLGGRLLLHDLIRAPLITTPIISQQKLLNLAYTMLGRNVVLGGFLERVLLNAQLPGEWTTDSLGRQTFVPRPLRFGAGSVNAIQGAEIRDEATGELKGYATPSVVYRDPVPVTTFAETRDIAYHAILEETRQTHALLSGDAGASGVSRQQATGDFLDSLAETAPQVERAARWLLETALSLAAHFAGQSGRYLDLRAVVSCALSAGPVTSEDVAQVISLVEAELLSRETGMARAGVDDTDAEAQRIQAEREARATVGAVALASFDSGN